MMNRTQRIYSDFPSLQGLWRPRPLNQCREVLDHLRAWPAVPVGILFLCLTGMRDLELWFVGERPRLYRTCRVVAVDQLLAQVKGADLVDAMLVFEEGEAEIRGWTQLCALVLWSELCGVEVSCQWTAQALHVLQYSVMPEAGILSLGVAGLAARSGRGHVRRTWRGHSPRDGLAPGSESCTDSRTRLKRWLCYAGCFAFSTRP